MAPQPTSRTPGSGAPRGTLEPFPATDVPGCGLGTAARDVRVGGRVAGGGGGLCAPLWSNQQA